MDTNAMVEPLFDDGRRFVEQLLDDGIVVLAAAWLKRTGEDRWQLYVATPLRDELGVIEAYGRVLGVFRQNEFPWLTDNEITLIGANSPVTREMVELLRRSPARIPFRARQPIIGGIPIDDAFIYPLGRPHTELTDEQTQILIGCYFTRNLRSVDDLPYTEDMDQIHREFSEQTGLFLSVRDVFKALKNLGRQGRLSGRSRHEQPMATTPG